MKPLRRISAVHHCLRKVVIPVCPSRLPRFTLVLQSLPSITMTMRQSLSLSENFTFHHSQTQQLKIVTSMAIAFPSAPSFYGSFFSCSRADCTRLTRFPAATLAFNHPFRSLKLSQPLSRRSTISSRFNSSVPSGAGGSVSPDNGDIQYELHHAISTRRRRRGSPVFVTLPADAVGPTAGQMRRRKAMAQSFRALAAAGVEGVVMEVWWGLVERDQPMFYNWVGYWEIVALARRCGLKIRAVMAFHQYGTGPGDPQWIPLPRWVLEEIDKNPDLAYSDRFGRRNTEYLSLGCDILPVLQGRSPLQAYTDFMGSFRDAFRPLLGDVITGVQIGMGPAGELRYPSCPSQKLMWTWRSRELGEFQCYDKYMLASLNACAHKIGMCEWGNGGPMGAGNLMHDPENTEFFKSKNGSWDSPYGQFFLKWYSKMLISHGERICKEAETIFRGFEISTSAKVATIHWHYDTRSHPSELTAGYYNTAKRDGYLPIARMFGKYGFSLCCTSFEMQDMEEKEMSPVSSPEGCLRQLLLAARVCDVPLEGENYGANLDDRSFQQVLKMSKSYTEGLEKPSFAFNFVRMDKNFFEYQNWVRFTRFVKQMSVVNIFRARLGSADISSSMTDVAKGGFAFTYSYGKAKPRHLVYIHHT